MNQTYPLLPLRDIVVFPGMVVPLFVGRDKSVAALEAAMEASKDIVLIAQLDPGCDDPEGDDLYDVGVIAQVLQLLKLPDGTVRVLVEGQTRARLSALEDVGTHLLAEVEPVEAETVAGSEVTALMRQVTEQFGEYVKLNKKMGEDAGVDLSEVDDAGQLADTIAAAISAKVSDKQGLLTETNPLKRLKGALGRPVALEWRDGQPHAWICQQIPSDEIRVAAVVGIGECPLDGVREQARVLAKSLGPADGRRLDLMLTSIREAEQRLQQDKEQHQLQLQLEQHLE